MKAQNPGERAAAALSTSSTTMPKEAKPVPKQRRPSRPILWTLKATYNALVSANFPNARIQS